MDKIKISTPKIILINTIETPPDSPRKYTVAIVDYDANINLENEASPTIPPFIMSNRMTIRLPYGNTMDSYHAAKIQLPGLTKKYRNIYIFPKMRTAPLILLGFLCDDGCTVTIYQRRNYSPK